MKVSYSGHSVYRTLYHIVWVTKYRRKALSSGFAAYTKKVLLDISSRIEGIVVEEINVGVDHVHVIVVIPPRYAVAKVVEILKGQSAKVIRKRLVWLEKVYYGTPSLWSVGYFVSTIGIDEAVIRRYVRYQQSQNLGQAQLEL